jgi:hypothetical protein
MDSQDAVGVDFNPGHIGLPPQLMRLDPDRLVE